MDPFREKLQGGTPQPQLGRVVKKSGAQLGKGEEKNETPPQTANQDSGKTIAEPQSCCMYSPAKNLQDTSEKTERGMRYPEIALLDPQEEEKETYVFVWQTQDKRVAQTDIREHESKKNRKPSYLKAVKHLIQFVWWFIIVL